MMDVIIKSKNLELEDELKSQIQKKIATLDKFFPKLKNTAKVYVELMRTTLHHRKGNIWRVEVNVDFKNIVIRAESENETLLKAINDVKDKLQRRIKKAKVKPFKK